jgi:hypothetical protein
VLGTTRTQGDSVPVVMSVGKGDTIVCVFTPGQRQAQGQKENWITTLPDTRRGLLTKHNRFPIDPKVPYVCTVRRAYEPSPEAAAGGKKPGWIVQVSRPVTTEDYNRVVDADFDANTLRFELQYPTAFLEHRFVNLKATVLEEGVGRGRNRALRVTLARNQATRSMEIGREEALRRGHRLNYFVETPATPAPARFEPVAQPGFKPNNFEAVGFLLEGPERLAAIALQCHKEAPILLESLARRRILSIAWTRRYDPLAPISSQAVRLEQALDYLARSAFSSNPGPLSTAKEAILRARLPLLSKPALAIVVNGRPWTVRYEASNEHVVMELGAYLEATEGFTDGTWDLRHRRVQNGVVLLNPQSLIGVVAAHGNTKHDGIVPADIEVLVANLVPLAAEPTREPRTKHARPAPDAFPPCIRRILADTQSRAATELERFHAAAYLRCVGYDARSIHSCVSGHEPMPSAAKLERMRKRMASDRFQPLPCQIAKELGLCAWDCGTAQTPLMVAA